MKPLRLRIKESSEETTTDIGKVIRKEQLPNDLSGTVLDPEVLRNGVEISLGPGSWLDILGRPIDKVMIPPISPSGRVEESDGLVFLHPISVTANNIVLMLSEKSYGARKAVQSLVSSLYVQLISRITSSKGLVASGIVGTRMPNSGRLVLVPTIAVPPNYAEISLSAMRACGIEEGERIIIFRDPVIHTGSFEVVRAIPTQNHVIALHPLLFKQLGADCDGDQVGFVKPPKDNPAVERELAAEELAFCKENATWPKSLCEFKGRDKEVDWDDPKKDTAKRFLITGSSYGLRDIAAWRKRPPAKARVLQHLSGKNFVEKNKEVALGKGIEERLLKANHANLFMKRFLGVVGNVARRVLLVCGQDKWLEKAANEISETIQQSTLDTKHKDKETAHPLEVMRMFNRSGKWKNRNIEECVKLLVQAEVSEEAAWRVLLHLRVELPLLLVLEQNCEDKEFLRNQKERLRSLLKNREGNAKQDFDVVPWIEDSAKQIGKEIGREISVQEFYKAVKELMFGLSDLTAEYYPGYEMVGKRARKDWKKMVDVYVRVFIEGVRDRGSLFRETFPPHVQADRSS